MKRRSVYVAGAWRDRLAIAQPAIDRLVADGVEVTHDWTRVEDRKGATGLIRAGWATRDLCGVGEAGVFWLMTSPGDYMCGSWVELGLALGNAGRIVVVSGPNANRTIFTELVNAKFAGHEAAYQYVLEACRG